MNEIRKLLLTAGAAAFSVLGAAASATTFNIDFVGAAAGNEQGVEGETLYFSELGYA